MSDKMMLNDEILDFCFRSPLVKDRLRGREVVPEILLPLINSTTQTLEAKRSHIQKLAARYEGDLPDVFPAFLAAIDKALDLFELREPVTEAECPKVCLRGVYRTFDDAVFDMKELARIIIARTDSGCSLPIVAFEDAGLKDNVWSRWEICPTEEAMSGLVEDPDLDDEKLTLYTVEEPISLIGEALEETEDESSAELKGLETADSICVYAVNDKPVLFTMASHIGGFNEVMFGGRDDSVLVSALSLFEGVYPVGTLLRMDLSPFYRNRFGLVLTRSSVEWVEDWGQYDFQSEKVLTRINDRWYAGSLAERHYQPIIDFIGPWLNSYTCVEEIDSKDIESMHNNYDSETLAVFRKVQARLLNDPSLGEEFLNWFNDLENALWTETCECGIPTEEILSWCEGVRLVSM